ncbi:MAG: SIS domain-containing protein [Bacteroidales bacterium]
MNYKNYINDYITLEIKTLQALDVDAINQALNLIYDTYESENTIFIFGNGGSAATASHFQNDFNKGISEHVEKKFHFVCLNDNVPTVMSIANDIGYDEIFRFQLKGNIKKGDIIIGISGSGNSPNVINAVEYGKSMGAKIIGITGFNGGRLKQIADLSLHAPVNSMQVSEDVHMIFDHLMMSVFYKTLCGIEHFKG